MSYKLRIILLPALVVLLVAGLGAQETGTAAASAAVLPNAPSFTVEQEQSSSQPANSQSSKPEPNPDLGEASHPQQNSARTSSANEQSKRILYIIPNYRAVSADANVPPLDAKGKFKLFLDDSFDYSTFLYVSLLAGIGMAERSVPEFGDGADAYGKYYYHSFADQAMGNIFTEFFVPVAFKQDPRYFTKGHGGLFNRTGYAITRLVVTRTDSGGSQFNYSEIVGNGAAAGIAGLYYPDGYRTWTKTGQRWGDQVALDGVFNILKEFWPDIRQNILHQKD